MLQIAGIAFLHVVVTALDAADVDGLAAPTLLILKDQHRAVPAKDIDQLQPILKPLVRDRLVVFPGVIDEQIERAAGQKELVRGMVDLLPPEVPDVQAEAPSVPQRKFVPVDGDALGGLLFRGQRLVGLVQTPEQTGLACTTLTEDEHFGFIQMVYLAQRPLAEVVENGLIALIHNLRGWICQGAVIDVDAITSPCLCTPEDWTTPTD